MAERKSRAKRFVVCVNNDGYPASLELHKIYRVVPDQDAEADGDIRVVSRRSSAAAHCGRWARNDG